MNPKPFLVHANDERLKSTIARHKAFWQRGEEMSFLRSVGIYALSEPVSLPQPDGTHISHTERLEPDMVDPAALIDELETLDPDQLDATLPMQGQYLVSVGLGDLIPISQPLRKIPWIEAMLGCPIKITEGQIWNEHYPGDPEEVIQRGVSLQQNAWFQLYVEFLHQLQARIGHRFPVADSLLRGPSDLAAAILGVQETCLGWIERPAFMARLMRVCTDAMLTVLETSHKVLGSFQGQYPCLHAILAPAPVVSTQADHSTLISPQMYEAQILPYDLEVIRCRPYSIFHIHNPGLHIAPLLAQVPELDVIQVAMDPFPTGERKQYEVQMLQMILEHKPLVLSVHPPSPEEGDWLLKQLPKRGLCFSERFDLSVYQALPHGRPGGESWLLG